MAAYSERHYGEHTWRLRHPQVIVEHMAETGSAARRLQHLRPRRPRRRAGRAAQRLLALRRLRLRPIFQLVNLRTRCRHTVGLNWTAIGIEHAGFADADVLDNRRQMHASLRLTQYLRCRFRIARTT